MYRVNPFTYIVEGFLGTSLANAATKCAENEILRFSTPAGQTCGEYLSPYMSTAGGVLLNPGAGSNGTECQYCPISDTNSFLMGMNVNFDNRWRIFGLLWVFCIFNIVAAVVLYWLVRVPKSRKVKRE